MLNPKSVRLSAGLYLVSTPIGTARDITLRGLDILRAADVLAAEDTRSLRKLMEIHGVPLGDRHILAYHDHNGAQMRPKILAALAEGKSVAYASEAGTPMVADPGFDLGRAAQEAGHLVTAAPGASAVITALTLAGLPTDAFFFAGFLFNSRGQRKKALKAVAGVPGSIVFYESPNRIAAMIRDAAEVLGGVRRAAICRELTKKFEEVLRGSLDELAMVLTERKLKGEIVVVIDRARFEKNNEEDIEEMLIAALAKMSVRDAADFVADQTGMPRRQIYQSALGIAKHSAEDDAD